MALPEIKNDGWVLERGAVRGCCTVLSTESSSARLGITTRGAGSTAAYTLKSNSL